MNRDTHKGWLIEQDWIGRYVATHPDFDPTPVYAGDPPADNRYRLGTRIAPKLNLLPSTGSALSP